ncbi:hypothetical protein WM24_23860 [Burkholderia ubonensis]|nr:hypothetical protein WM24_23860 [Burkholderia ubonensis]
MLSELVTAELKLCPALHCQMIFAGFWFVAGSGVVDVVDELPVVWFDVGELPPKNTYMSNVMSEPIQFPNDCRICPEARIPDCDALANGSPADIPP